MLQSPSRGSLTKEPPLSTLDAAITWIRRGTTYADLGAYCASSSDSHPTVPALVKNRFLLLDETDTIVYDSFLSLVNSEGIGSGRVRKVMFFIWAFRDERLRKFIQEVVADKNGRWRPKELTKKANADFFETWLNDRSSAKARSNIERYLVESRIFNPASKAVDLDLSDGWLSEAILAVAQLEKDPVRRQRMVTDPGGFLVAEGLNALANATDSELVGQVGPSSVPEDPLEDEGLLDAPTKKAQNWKAKSGKVGGGGVTIAVVNHVAKERANAAHQGLENLLGEAARNAGFQPKFTANIDVYFETPHGTVLAEVKSCHDLNLHSQVRKGVSQLFEYRYLERSLLGDKVECLLLLETPPTKKKGWLVEYLNSLGILVAWGQPEGAALLTSSPIPESLKAILSPV